MMYRSTPHSTTGISPAELLHGRKMRTKLPELAETNIDDIEIRDRDSENKEKRERCIVIYIAMSKKEE